MNKEYFIDLLKNKILLLDGAMGTMIQASNLTEKDFRGNRFKEHKVELYGCNDILCLVSPSIIEDIHHSYLKAGADIITTNTFNANSISLKDYDLHDNNEIIKEINREGVVIARKAVERARSENLDTLGLVAGSIGPTNRTASMSNDVNDPSARNITYDDLFDAYKTQIEGLIEGGVDILLFETVFDTLNLKAGLDAANNIMKGKGKNLPVMVSVTISGISARTLSGQTIGAFVNSIEGYDHVVSIGLNCGFGPAQMKGWIKELSVLSDRFISCHPNAGLPDEMGEYCISPENFVEELKPMVMEGEINIIGGCCGTTPDHIATLRKLVKAGNPHLPKKSRKALRLSGLDPLYLDSNDNFLVVGERCNVAGSRKFLRLINEDKLTEASAIAFSQIEAGASIIDINMDDPLLDAKKEMVRFIRYISGEPEIARVPFMIDSSVWEVIEEALKNCQGKGIVNSLSLKEGEEAFINKAIRIRELGFALIVMAFDEKGQADTFERKIEIVKRSYDLLTQKCGYKAEDIIFDVNVMAIATGIPEHDRYALDFIEAVRWIKENLPGAKTSGGISNLSFAFRGKNKLREMMHTIFLYHARKAGLDMGIVNPSATLNYEEIEPEARKIIEDVILARRSDFYEELMALSTEEDSKSDNKNEAKISTAELGLEERLEKALITGKEENLKKDLDEALKKYGSALKIIEGVLMDGMKKAGDLFGEGKIFLPQMVKTARVMKMAVEYLRPEIEKENSAKNSRKAGKVLIATVKGDVHDIGKNIVSIVLNCNNYEIEDLGVMVPPEEIVEAVKRLQPDFICLSGLITPSLAEMVNVVKVLEEEGISIPIMVGGATTSKLHTALKIAPYYTGPVIHVLDASQNPIIAGELRNDVSRSDFLKKLENQYQELRKDYEKRNVRLIPFEEVKGKRKKVNEKAVEPLIGVNNLKIYNIPLEEIIPLINWKMFFNAWGIRGKFLESFPYDLCDGCIALWKDSINPESKKMADESLKLYRDAKRILNEIRAVGKFDGRGAIVFFAASASDETVTIENIDLPMLRQQKEGSEYLSVSDYISNEGDYLGLFAITAGRWMQNESISLKEKGELYESLIYQSLADRIVEASSEWLHDKVIGELWGIGSIRPAWGYPMLPDQTMIKEVEPLLPFKELGIDITENGAMYPTASVSGLYIGNPDAKYFSVGEIGEDQLASYAGRRNMSVEKMKGLLRF